MTRVFKLLNIVANTVQDLCSGETHIFSYASDRSIFERNCPLAKSLLMVSWSGMGVKSANVLSLH